LPLAATKRKELKVMIRSDKVTKKKKKSQRQWKRMRV